MTGTAPPATDPRLTDVEQAMLDGAHGPAVAMAMRLVVALARVRGASRLIEVSAAHIDSCLYHGRAGLDFATRLVELGGTVRIPTTLNVGSLDLLHPAMVLRRTPAEQEVATQGRALMDAYVALGCRPTWTCAPYQVDARPGLGEHIAWAESNAIVFANSVLGARTDRYGDFLDICAAVTGRAPLAGLHLSENRRGDLIIDCSGLPERVLDSDLAYPLLGYVTGLRCGSGNPVLLGLPPDTSEDRLKALGAAAASSGGVALFHAVGVTPEAPTLAAALQGRDDGDVERVVLTTADLAAARRELSTAGGDHLDAISLGTPHASLAEIRALAEGVQGGAPLRAGVPFYLSTGRSVLEQARAAGHVEVLEDAGITFVVDTCTYVTSILDPGTRVVMTTSGKWAHYAPANLGIDVVLGSLQECLASARAGKVVLDDALFG
ncbi:aconitase X [Ornithinimicrobium cavernae]|uniref:aconitase X n=1 Tax=Ornithinimicrobium cavernae TaxID=2666047 RepID=UPI001F44C4A1|nr:aconitase X catalytic domain-containing protein [Ornithinimicrobium cavernae]